MEREGHSSGARVAQPPHSPRGTLLGGSVSFRGRALFTAEPRISDLSDARIRQTTCERLWRLVQVLDNYQRGTHYPHPVRAPLPTSQDDS